MVLLPSLGLFLSGCATPNAPAVASAARPRFHDASAANVVLRFASWDYIFMVHPELRDGEYFHQLRREDVAAAVKQYTGSRDLAVVTVGWGFEPEQLHQIVSDWETLLTGCGFRRVVVVRANINYQIDGAIIVDDSIASISTSRPTAAL